MSLPVTVPFTFGNATTAQSLSSLDTNFTTITNSVNGLTNGASQINVASISATGTANATTFLRGDGVWGTPAGGGGSGTVTSVNVNGGTTGLTTSGGPVTTSGNITIAGTLVAANGGTGLTSVGTSGNVLTSNGTVWLSSAGAYPLTLSTVNAGGTNPFPATGGPTSVGFTGIPSWVKRITVIFSGFSTSGTSGIIVQLGTSSGYANSGYTGSVTNGSGSIATTAFTAGHGINGGVIAANAYYGTATFTLISGNIWVGSSILGATGTPQFAVGGSAISLAATFDRIQVTTIGGTDTFDAGSINILYE
jgi:hypothetical protein